MRTSDAGFCCDACVMAIEIGEDAAEMSPEQLQHFRDTLELMRAGVNDPQARFIVGSEDGFSWSECNICAAAAGNRHVCILMHK